MSFALHSNTFQPNGRIPSAYTCDGRNISPALEWIGAPVDTQSFAIVCSDPDAPAGIWYHWAIYDIPATRKALAEGFPRQGEAAKQGENDFRRIGYDGPCPPPKHGAHHYHFRIFALSVPHLPVKADKGCRDIDALARRHALGSAELIGVYSR